MDDKKSKTFADILIPGEEGRSAGNEGGMRIPPAGGHYAGKGAYKGKNIKVEEELCFSYDPHLAFIEDVQVYTWGARRSFYERFREDALRYRGLRGNPAEHVPFFSYIPQYSQMNLYQSNFYLWFRELAGRGEYIYADLSYILLYIYEIINLSDISDPAEDVNILCSLWMAYRDTYPALDKYMGEWVCDYCLLYRLPVPEVTLSILPKLCETATLREFYMSGAVKDGASPMGEICESFADYDYRRSRVDLPPDLFHHFPRALEAACSIFDSEHFVATEPVTVMRDAFCGSLCAHNVKRKISVKYYPVFRRSGVRHMLGAAVKYTENKLRRVAGIRSRLHTDGLPDASRDMIDRYFETALPEVFGGKRSAPTRTVPEYEHLYDAPEIPFTPDAAARIELESRAAAELLSADIEAEGAVPILEETSVVTDVPVCASGKSHVAEALRILLEGGSFEDWCREKGLYPDTVAGEINERASEEIGDALLEMTDEGWQIIPDYLEEAAELAVE